MGAVVLVAVLVSAFVSVGTQVALERAGGLSGLLGTAPATTPDEVRVPEVVGLTQPGADEVLHDRGLRIRVRGEQSDPTAPKDVVLTQEPLPGSRVLPDAEVAVVISSGPAALTVPKLIGTPLAEAKAALQALGVTLGPLQHAPGEAPGTVLSSLPAAGQPVAAGQVVVLTVAESAQVSVPDLDNQHIDEAKAALAAAGLRVGRVRERYNARRRGYRVLSQTPAAGAEVAPGSAVDLVINQGD